jgi:hypothetical protein
MTVHFNGLMCAKQMLTAGCGKRNILQAGGRLSEEANDI